MPKGIILIVAFIIWWIYNDTSRIFLSDSFFDYKLLAVYNLEFLVYIFWVVSSLLWLVAIFCIFKKHRYGINVLYSLFAINIIFMIVGTWLQIMDIDTAKELYIDSRESRWLNIDNVNQIINPISLTIMSFIYILFYWYLARYIYKNQSYFQK